MEQQDLNKRLLIALLLSFLVFIGYSYLFPAQTAQKANETTTQGTATQEVAKNVAPTNSVTGDTAAKSAPAPTTTSSEKAAAAPVVSNSNIIAVATSNIYKMSIDELGRIDKFELVEKKYRDDEGKNLQILNAQKVKPLEIRFSDQKLNEEAFKTPYVNSGAAVVDVTSGSKTITLTQTLSTLTLTKKIILEPNGAYNIDISTSKQVPYFVTPGYRPMADDSRYLLVRGAVIIDNEDVTTTIEDKDAKGDEVIKNAKIVSAFDRYVASILYNFNDTLNVSIVKEEGDNPLIFIEGKEAMHLGGYIGPKEYKTLKAINPELTNTIEFGWFTFLSRPFFKVLVWIEGIVGNWGWAIILFTLLVKLILFPLSYKGMMSMQKLKDLAPKMKELKTKYKDDPAKMNMQMMEMYKKNGANPLGGCLPMLLQIPVFFALYRVLLNADELQGAAWIPGWISDLSSADPYYILPVLMGVTMWFQQKITPNNFTDPLQEKIFQWFPVMMAVMFIIMPFPSGLVLYWVTNNIFTIGQQYIINKSYQKQKISASQTHQKK